MKRARSGATELISTIIIIAISIIASLSAAIYINGLAGSKMQEHSKNAADLINKNNEEVIIIHIDYDSQYCNRLGVWLYNVGSIDSKIVRTIIDGSEISLSNNRLPRAEITIICISYSLPGEHELEIELEHGNRIETEVII